jgi:rsbT co-antagonist protein RsbR
LSMNTFISKDSGALLDTIGENIFVTDLDFTIVYVNHYADVLIEKISPYTELRSHADYVGKNVDELMPKHADQIRNTLPNYESYPYVTTINLFSKFIAHLVINPYEVDGERVGYVLTWSDVTEYEAEIRNINCMMEEMYTPIIETVLENVILVPIVGVLTEPRIKQMKSTILKACEERGVLGVIFDYTGMESFTEPYLIGYMKQAETALSLLGVKVYNTGMRASVADELSNHLSIEKSVANFFPTLRHAMHHCMKEKGYELIKPK